MNYFSYEFPSADLDQALQRVTVDEVRELFADNPEQLEWLALFLTADKQLASVCMVDACVLATMPDDIYEQWLQPWIRCCTIRSAVEMQRSRMSLLASIYEGMPCFRRDYVPLRPAILDLLYERALELGRFLDVLCRAVVVLMGIERYSSEESAQMLGVSQVAVETAYCTAMEFLEVLHCEATSLCGVNAQACC